MKSPNFHNSTESIRQFNRFYTRQIGVLNRFLLDSKFSLAEARLIYELASRGSATATELRVELNLDAGYLSRMIKGLEKLKLIEKQSETNDARKSNLSLSKAGWDEFEKLDEMSRKQIKVLLSRHPPSEQSRLVDAMRTIQSLLEPKKNMEHSYILRNPAAGDLGWVVHINGIIYAEEYGWDETYEALIAEIVADFVKNFDAKKERCWIAERNGENVGCVFLVKDSPSVARLRVLIVDPASRGLGIGKRLVHECTRFARQAGYKKITLWTQSVLSSARAIYKNSGYEITATKKNHMFGKDLESETWELIL